MHNQGNQTVDIDIYIDEVSGILRRWCDPPYKRLALGQGQNSTVVFQINVLLEAILDTYNYTLVVDAPEHYPDDTLIVH